MFGKRPLLFVAFIAAAVIIPLGYKLRTHGFSAREKPMAIEVWLAEHARDLATPSAVKALVNPIQPTPMILAGARDHYADHCATCHGNKGDGKTMYGDGMFPPPPDLRAELLRLLAEGQLTPEQAIQLAQILESGALGETGGTAEARLGAPSPDAASETAPAATATDGAVTEASFDATASESYRAAFTALAAHPDAQVRLAVAQMSQSSTRDAAMETLWTYANDHPDDPLRDEIYLLCGSVGEANNNPLGQRALEQATSLRSRDPAVWRMLSRSYQRANRSGEAQAAAQVSEGVEAQNAGDTAQAEAQLQQALPQLTAPQLRAPVASELGQIAEARGDFSAASARFSQAYTAREEVAQAAPDSAAAGVIQADAQQLVRALDRSGRTREACERLRQAQEQHDVAAPDEELLQRCQRQFRTNLRNDVQLAPQLRQRAIQVRPEVTPAPTP